MTAYIHKGQQLRHKTETTWPTIMVSTIHAEPTATFGGVPLQPFAFVEWSDNPGVYTAMNLATIEKDWEDTGV
jgi:hypothetical protein